MALFLIEANGEDKPQIEEATRADLIEVSKCIECGVLYVHEPWSGTHKHTVWED